MSRAAERATLRRGIADRQEVLGLATSATVIAIVGFATATHGAVEPWSEAIVLAAGVVLATLFLIAAVTRRTPSRVRTLLGIALAMLLLAASQVTPVPTSVVETLSAPRVTALQEALLPKPDFLTVSYYPEATQHALQKLLLAVVVFAAVATAVRQTTTIRWLLAGLFAIGAAESLLGIAQFVSGATGMYWSEARPAGPWFGSFVNHSNVSQLLNLTAGAGIGLLFVRFAELKADRRRSSYPPDVVVLLAGIAIHVVAIASSLSRGGLIGATIAGLVVVAHAQSKKRLDAKAWGVFFVPAIAFLALAFVDFDRVYERVRTLEAEDSYVDRIELSQAVLQAGAAHPLAGIGLGTHAYVFPAYDTTGSVAAAEHADNDYVQVIEEVGLAGVTLSVVALALLVNSVLSPLARSGDPISRASYGALFALVAILVQSLTDFGQRLPAVYCTSAAVAGVAISLDARRKLGRASSDASSRSAIGQRLVGAAIGVLLVAATIWATRDAASRWRADSWWQIAYETEGAESTEIDLIDQLAAAEEAATVRPGNVEYRTWLNALRWRVLTDDESATVEVLATAEGREFALQIAEDLRLVRQLCPTYAPPVLIEGAIRSAINDDQGPKLLALATRLAPNNANLVVQAVSAGQGRIDADIARPAIDRAVRLEASLYDAVLGICVDDYGDPEWAVELAGENAQRLQQLASYLEPIEGQAELATELREEVERLLEAAAVAEDASPHAKASLAARRARQGDVDEAIRLYREALGADFNNTRWRLSLAQLLIEEERFEEAYREARTVLRFRPQDKTARRLAEELSVKLPTEAL